MRKILTLLTTLLLLSCFSMPVMAQEANDISVIAGNTTITDLLTIDEALSSTLGAIISSCSYEQRRYIEYSGVDIWMDEQLSDYQNFEIYAFPIDSNPNFDNVTVGALFETSLTDVDIRGVIGTFSTNDATYAFVGADTAVLAGFGDTMTYDDTHTIIITSDVDANSSNVIINGAAPSVITWAQTWAPAGCPTDEQFLDIYDLTGITIKETALPGPLGKFVCKVVHDGGTNYIVDKNSDATWEFDKTFDGFQTNAITGQTLMILDVGTYDVFGIMP